MRISSLSGSALKSPHTTSGMRSSFRASAKPSRSRVASCLARLSSNHQASITTPHTRIGPRGPDSSAYWTRAAPKLWLDSGRIGHRDITATPERAASSSWAVTPLNVWCGSSSGPARRAHWLSPSVAHDSASTTMSGRASRSVSRIAASRSCHGPYRPHTFHVTIRTVVSISAP